MFLIFKAYLSKPYVGIEELGSDDSSLNRKLYSYRRSTSPVAYDYGVSRRYASGKKNKYFW